MILDYESKIFQTILVQIHYNAATITTSSTAQTMNGDRFSDISLIV